MSILKIALIDLILTIAHELEEDKRNLPANKKSNDMRAQIATNTFVVCLRRLLL